MGLFSKKDKSKSSSSSPAPPPQSSYTPPPSHSPVPQQDIKQQNALFGNRPQISSDQKSNPYASNPYAAANAQQQQQQQQSSSSYGRDDRDVKRDQLFSGRTQPQEPAQGGYNSNPYERPGAGGYGAPPPYGSSGPSSSGPSYGGRPNNQNNGDPSYNPGGYGEPAPDRQLTAEEEEEEDVEAVKQQIRFTKQESVSSTRNALRYAAEAEETGRATLARLGQQGERLYNTEKNLDVAASHNRVAEDKARELKTLNGSMFAIHMKNPMKSASRQAAEEQKILDRHQYERTERDRARQYGYETKQNIDRALGGKTGYQPSVGRPAGMSMAERQKYQFEADEEDDEMEREIDSNLTQLGDVAGRLKALAIATGQETDRQNAKISQLTQKVRVIIYGITQELDANNANSLIVSMMVLRLPTAVSRRSIRRVVGEYLFVGRFGDILMIYDSIS